MKLKTLAALLIATPAIAHPNELPHSHGAESSPVGYIIVAAVVIVVAVMSFYKKDRS